MRTASEMEDLIAAAQSTERSRTSWRPLNLGRHVLDIMQECGMVNARYAAILESRQWVVWPVERFLERKEQLDTVDKAAEQLRRDTSVLIEAIRSLSDECLMQAIEYPAKKVRTVAETALFPLNHMAYHEGQVNYIQTLYGDWVTHY